MKIRVPLTRSECRVSDTHVTKLRHVGLLFPKNGQIRSKVNLFRNTLNHYDKLSLRIQTKGTISTESLQKSKERVTDVVKLHRNVNF